MPFKDLRRIPIIFSFPFLLLILGSCEKFKGDQTIPAWLRIDSIKLNTDYNTQGTASQAITDSWVYVDDNLVGVFQNPCTFPVLKEGSHKVTIMPGIKKNGIASTRAAYPFYTMLNYQVKLNPDSITSLGTLTAAYSGSTEFLWMEDFEHAAISLDTTNRSTLRISTTPAGSPLTFEGDHSGLVDLTDSLNFFECVTHDKFPVPSGPVYLEMNFRTENAFTVGVYVYQVLSIYEAPVIVLVPTGGQWKKIYIDLSNTIYSYIGATFFKVYINASKDIAPGNRQILIDNFKLVTGPA